MHFGPGAFFRAHTADYLDRFLAKDPRFGVAAVSLKSAGMRDSLTPQDGLYALLQIGKEAEMRAVGAVRAVLVGPEEVDRFRALFAAPTTTFVTITVTEKGYCLDLKGRLDVEHADVKHDRLNPGAIPCSLPGWLVAGLRARHAAGVGGLVVLSCDNMMENGSKAREAVLSMARLQGDQALADWIFAEVAFPNAMVDSITPATDDALREQVGARWRVEDAAPVRREPFTQWFIEDSLRVAHPTLAAGLAEAGVTFAPAVGPYEQAKLRVVNGGHSTLAYAGFLRGFETVCEAASDPALGGFVEAMLRDEIAATLDPSIDATGYIDATLARFRNPGLGDKLLRIAQDGSQKLPIRILRPLAENLRAGRPTGRLAVPLAAWMAFVRRRATDGIAIFDPLADTLQRVGAQCNGDPDHDIGLFLALDAVFPRAIAEDGRVCEALREAYASVLPQ